MDAPPEAVVLRHVLGGLPLGVARPALEALEVASALSMAPADLPGPTGESNRLILEPRGVALCLGIVGKDGLALDGEDGRAALAQAVQALALGNATLLTGPGIGWLSAHFGDRGGPLGIMPGLVAPETLTALSGLDVLLAEGAAEGLRHLRLAMAARSGPILPICFGALDPERLVLERAISIDTTAAGGNAALLAAAG